MPTIRSAAFVVAAVLGFPGVRVAFELASVFVVLVLSVLAVEPRVVEPVLVLGAKALGVSVALVVLDAPVIT